MKARGNGKSKEGVPSGEKQADGAYPEGTVNYLVDKRLKELEEGLRINSMLLRKLPRKNEEP